MDFAFKSVLVAADHGTVLSALKNLGNRIKADVMILVSLEYNVIANTLQPEVTNKAFLFPELIETCEEQGMTSCILPFGDSYYQMVVVPLLAPDPIAWFCIGFLIDEPFVREYQKLVLSDVSILMIKSEGKWSNIASTLSPILLKDLFTNVSAARWSTDKSVSFNMNGSEYITLITPLEERNGTSIYAVLQRSLEEVLQPYYNLRKTILIIGSVILFIAVGFSILLSRGITRPVQELAMAARVIGGGQLDTTVNIRTGDELEQLGNAFNDMTKGLKERDLIRSTFERYVSPAIAAEVIRNPDLLHLGGQKKTLTIFFTDIGNFTNLSEILSPEKTVNHLNHYFKGMCSAILEYNGTINRFQGDAILAFWGAPIAQEDHAFLACKAALRCREFLKQLEKKWVAGGLPPRTYRFGINTGEVVIGNVGSASRFEYMAVGEDVNLANRLEGVNKYYGTQILISEKTYLLIKDMFLARDIDIIRVVGNSKPIKVYELVAEKGQIDGRKAELLEHCKAGVHAYRARQWGKAISCFTQVLQLEPEDGPAKVYVKRCQEYQQASPAQDWDGVYNLTTK